MAIYTPSADYSSLANAYAIKDRVTQAGHAIEQQKINTQMLDLNDEILNINQKAIDLNRDILYFNAAISLIEIGGKVVEDVILQKQMEKAKTSAIDAGADLSRIIADSILNGGTQAIQGDDGKWAIQLDPAIEQWYNNQIEAIGASKNSKAVKQWQTQALAQTFANGQTQVINQVLKETMATIDQQHDLNMTSALQTDALTGSYEMGTTQINSRTDLSPAQKALQIQAYQKTVDFNHENHKISAISTTEGLAKATEYAYSLSNQFTPEQVQSFVKTASVTDQQLSQAIGTNAATAMASGLDSGKAPAALYEQIASYTEEMPEDRKLVADEAARAAHTAWATRQGYMISNIDLQSVDVDYLKDRRDSIIQENGELNQTIFAGLDKTPAAFAAMYEKRIDELEKLEATTLSNQNKEQIKENKAITDATFALLQQGEISPAQAIEAMHNLDSANSTEGYEDDLYQTQMLNKINDAIVPEQYKTITKDFLKKLEGLKFGIKVDKKKGITPEQNAYIAEATYFANEAIANIFMNTAAKDLTPDQVARELERIENTFVGKAVKALESGEVVDKWRPFRDPKAIDDALEKLHTFGDQQDTIPVQKDRHGNFVWSNQNYKATFDAIGQELTQLLSENGVTPTSLAIPITIDGVAKPAPIIQGEFSDGRSATGSAMAAASFGTMGLDKSVPMAGTSRFWFTVNKNDIFWTTDPSGSDGWHHWKSIDTVKKFKKENEIDGYFDIYR